MLDMMNKKQLLNFNKNMQHQNYQLVLILQPVNIFLNDKKKVVNLIIIGEAMEPKSLAIFGNYRAKKQLIH